MNRCLCCRNHMNQYLCCQIRRYLKTGCFQSHKYRCFHQSPRTFWYWSRTNRCCQIRRCLKIGYFQSHRYLRSRCCHQSRMTSWCWSRMNQCCQIHSYQKTGCFRRSRSCHRSSRQFVRQFVLSCCSCHRLVGCCRSCRCFRTARICVSIELSYRNIEVKLS
jgi:hypothetical protein